MSLSNYGENLALDLLLENTTHYVALCFTKPAEGHTGADLNEPTTGDYARVSIAPADWRAAASGRKRNDVILQFPTATANWGSSPLRYFAICTASGGGNVIASGPLGAARRVRTGYTPYFPAGSIVCSAD